MPSLPRSRSCWDKPRQLTCNIRRCDLPHTQRHGSTGPGWTECVLPPLLCFRASVFVFISRRGRPSTDTLSNEALHTPLPRTKTQFRGFRGPSQAIRKIHMDADFTRSVSQRTAQPGVSRPFSIGRPVLPIRLIASDLLTPSTFWKTKLRISPFHRPNI